MMLPRTARSLPALLLLTACGGAAPPPAETAAAAPTAAPQTAPPAAPPAEPPPESGAGARDPKLAEMAKAALACSKNDEYHSFDRECAGFKAWYENEELFENGKGDDTVFSMYGDPDVRVRYLAMVKPISDAYWQDKAHAKAVFALAHREKTEDLLRKIGVFAGKVDAEKLGLGDELKELAKHPSAAFRQNLADALIPSAQTKAAFEVELMLLDDPDRSVKVAAINGLVMRGGPSPEPVCTLLTKQFARGDALHAVALMAGAASKCPGMRELVAAELDKHTADPSKVPFEESVGYNRAAFSLCSYDAPPELKKKAFEIGKRLVDRRVTDVNTRENALDTVAYCDHSAAEKLLTTLAKDKDLGERVKSKLAWLKETREREAREKKGKKK